MCPSRGRVETIRRRVYAMRSDPSKVYRQDAGRPERCEVYARHVRENAAEVVTIRDACERGALGCSDCRERLVRVERLREE